MAGEAPLPRWEWEPGAAPAAAAAPAPVVHAAAAAGRAALVSGTAHQHQQRWQCLQEHALLHLLLRGLGPLQVVAGQPFGLPLLPLLLLLRTHQLPLPQTALLSWLLEEQPQPQLLAAAVAALPRLQRLLLPPPQPWPAAAPWPQSRCARRCGRHQWGSRDRCTCEEVAEVQGVSACRAGEPSKSASQAAAWQELCTANRCQQAKERSQQQQQQAQLTVR